MRKNKILSVIAAIICIILIVISIFMRINYKKHIEKRSGIYSSSEYASDSDEDKIRVGNLKFGYDKCDNNEEEHPTFGATVMTNYKCAICGKEDEYGSSPAPELCEDCAKITNRCRWCGKLNY